MNKKELKIKVCDFWDGVDENNIFLVRNLKEKYNIVASDEPDFLFYSCFGNEFREYKNCVKIFYTGESIIPDFNECDYAIGFDYIKFEDRYLRFPLYALSIREKQNRENLSSDLVNRKFCNFIYSNANFGEGALLRQEFCKKLMEYKHVDCPGMVLNNMKNAIEPRDGDWGNGKLEFIKNYKFTIAVENTSSIGYTTEKLIQPLDSFSIPIYWGNPEVAREFNPKAFINCHEYKNFDEVIERVIELDNNDDLYMEMLSQPIMQSDYKFDTKKQLENFIIHILEKGNSPFPKVKEARNKGVEKSLMLDILEFKKNILDYYIYKFLSKVTFGKTRSQYKEKRKALKFKIQKLRSVIEHLKTAA